MASAHAEVSTYYEPSHTTSAFKWVKEIKEDGNVVLHPTIIVDYNAWKEFNQDLFDERIKRLYELYSLPGQEVQDGEMNEKLNNYIRTAFLSGQPNHTLATVEAILEIAGRAKQEERLNHPDPETAWQGFNPPVRDESEWQNLKSGLILNGGMIDGRQLVRILMVNEGDKYHRSSTAVHGWLYRNWWDVVDWPKGMELNMHFPDKPEQTVTSFAEFDEYLFGSPGTQ